MQSAYDFIALGCASFCCCVRLLGWLTRFCRYGLADFFYFIKVALVLSDMEIADGMIT